MKGWKRGLPPGPYYEGMLEDYEVYFTMGGPKWHRKRTEEEKQAYIAQCAAHKRRRESLSSQERQAP